MTSRDSLFVMFRNKVERAGVLEDFSFTLEKTLDVMFTLHVIDYIHKHNVNGVIPSMDVEESFGRGTWIYFYRVLHKFGVLKITFQKIHKHFMAIQQQECK